MALAQGRLRWVGMALAAVAFTIGVAALAPPPANAQPMLPATYFGSASIDGERVPDGTLVRGFVGEKDCTQPPPTGTLTDGDVSAYVLIVMHESQEPGCGREGATVTFRIGEVTANETATWRQGPHRLDLNAGSGQPQPLPTLTPTPTLGPTEVAATATEDALFTPAATPSVLPTDDVELPGTPGSSEARATRTPSAPGSGDSGDDDGSDGGGVVWVILGGLAVLAALGGAGGYLFSRRRAAPGDATD